MRSMMEQYLGFQTDPKELYVFLFYQERCDVKLCQLKKKKGGVVVLVCGGWLRLLSWLVCTFN